jgi:hypothetical protein
MLPHRLLTPLVALALLATLAACGQERTAAERIRQDTADVVTAMNVKDVAAARRALNVLEADVRAAGRLNQLEDAEVTSLLEGVDELRADLALLAPKVVTTPTTRPTTQPPRKGDGDGEGKKKRDEEEKDD